MLGACSSSNEQAPHKVFSKNINEDQLVLTDEALANRIDGQFKALEKELLGGKLEQLVFVKQKGSQEIIAIPKGEELPKDVKFLYTVLRNKEKQVVIFDEYPVSEEGDWEIIYRHHFDSKGNTFAFIRQTNFPNSICADGQAYETIKEYYSTDFQLVKQFYNLVDANGQKFKKIDCVIRFDFDYPTYSNAEQVIKNRLKGVQLD